MKLEDLLAMRSSETGTKTLKLNDEGICAVTLDDHYTVVFETDAENQGFYLYSVVGALPPDKREAAALLCLKGNLFGKETGSSNIGYDENANAIVLFKYLPHEATDYEAFKEHIREFMAFRAYWEKRLDETLEVEKERKTMPKDKDVFFA